MSEPAARLDTPATPSPAGAEAVGLWTIVKESVRGEVHHDSTEGPIGRAILLLAVPMCSRWYSRACSRSPTSSGSRGSVPTRRGRRATSRCSGDLCLAMGLGIGPTALVARRIGEKDLEGAARGAAQALLLALLVSVVRAWPGCCSRRTAGADAARRPSSPPGAATPRSSGRRSGDHRALRGERHLPRRGDAAIAMRVLWLRTSATSSSVRCSSSAWARFPAWCHRRRHRHHHRALGGSDLRRGSALPSGESHPVNAAICGWTSASAPDPPAVGSATLKNLVGWRAGSGWCAYWRDSAATRWPATPSRCGSSSSSCCHRGVSAAAATMVGQSLGAKGPDRAELSVSRAGRYNAYVLTGVGVLFFLFADPARVHLGAGGDRLRRHLSPHRGARLPAVRLRMVLTQSFNGAGDTWTPTWLNLACSGPSRSRSRGCWPTRRAGTSGVSGRSCRVLDAGLASAWVFARGSGRRAWSSARPPGAVTPHRASPSTSSSPTIR